MLCSSEGITPRRCNTHNGTKPAFLHHVYNRATVLGVKFRFGRPNFLLFFNAQKNQTTTIRTAPGRPSPGSVCRGFFDFAGKAA